MTQFNTSCSKPVIIYHPNLILPITGFATEGTSKNGTPGAIIFIPTTKIDETLTILGAMV